MFIPELILDWLNIRARVKTVGQEVALRLNHCYEREITEPVRKVTLTDVF
jgi:hypothetical protein